jgi:hypothetical protein
MFWLHESGELMAFAARGVVTGVALGQGVMPIFIDLNRTHATHPMWPGHARFHVVWQTSAAALFGALETALLWWPGPAAAERFYLAALLTALPLLGFLAAMVSRRWYGGTLHDPLGIKPVRITLGGRVLMVDMNAVLVVTATVLLPAAVLLFRAATVSL